MPRAASTTLVQPIFNEGNVTPDPTRFKTKHPSDNQLYKQLGNLTSKDVVAFKKARGNPGGLYTLQQALGIHGNEVIDQIQKAGKIIFHAAGDTGASNEGKYGTELRVSDQLTSDCRLADVNNRPRFMYHLGDIVYSFGESKYYYDQFYEPFRDYPAPIVALAGNHDSFVIPGTSATNAPLSIFSRNFCAPKPTITTEAAALHRTSMTQPGVYFSFDAPFVRIIGLFSNALEDPGVISSQKWNKKKQWPVVPDFQLEYLSAQLKQIKTSGYAGAVIIAVHHPPFSYAPPPKKAGTSGQHKGSPDMLHDIDAACKSAGVYPHAVLSGHAHNYQRFTRTLSFGGKTIEVPFIVCGDGGHNVVPIIKAKRGQPPVEPHFGADVKYLDAGTLIPVKGLKFEHCDDANYGYLRVTVDKNTIQIAFHQVGKGSIQQSRADVVTVDIANHALAPNR